MDNNELEKIAASARAKKGRMDAASRDKAAELIASIWTNESGDVEHTLSCLGELQSEAVAAGIGNAWGAMLPDRRALFEGWLLGSTGDRASRRIALLIPEILETDGKSAFRWLQHLIRSGRKNTSKDLRQLLTSILFGDKRLRFENLGDTDAPVENVIRLYTVLLDVAFDPKSSVSPMTKSLLAAAVLRYLQTGGEQSQGIAADLQERITDELKKWPGGLREQFQRQVRLMPASVPSTKIASDLPESATVRVVQPVSPPIPISVPVEPPNLSGQLETTIVSVASEIDRLKQICRLVSDFEAAQSRMSAELGASKAEIADLRSRLQKELEANRALSSEVDAQRSIQTDLRSRLEQLMRDTELERKRLAQQISVNAVGRIDEFKKRLGLTLSRLVVDLPHADMQVSAELGKILLLQFHQFLEVLRNEGVETASRVA